MKLRRLMGVALGPDDYNLSRYTDSCHSLVTPLARRFTGLSSNRHNVLMSTRATNGSHLCAPTNAAGIVQAARRAEPVDTSPSDVSTIAASAEINRERILHE
jgi:hypothetical protein